MSREINVVKRDGTREPYQHEKIQRQIAFACEGIANVSQSMIELNMDLELYDGITTAHIDQLAINAAVKLIVDPEGDVNYQYVAGRLRNSVLRKEVYGQYDPPPLFEIVKRNVERGLYTPELLEWYTEDEWGLMDTFVDHSRDETLSYAAISQLIAKYLVSDRSTGEVFETPQVRYIVAAAVAMHAEEKSTRLRRVNEYYKAASSGSFSLPTPILAGLGTPTKQFSSCVLIKSDDTLDSIFASGEMLAKYAAKRAGIGLEIGRLRPAGAPIRGGEISHTGLVPFLKKWFGDLRCCSQGGIRNASMTVNYPMWHYEFPELIVLKNNSGTEETRVRHLDYAVVTCKYLWNRYRRGENITLFDPNQVPDLYEAFYSDQKRWIELYEKYERSTKLRKRVISAEEAFRALVKERTDTGRIYLVFIDNVIAQGPIDSKKHPIYQSNLCMEILLPTVPFQRLDDENGRIALCNLGSLNWGKFRKPEDMRKACRMLVRSLNNILDYQTFLSVQSQLANEDFKPLGIGVTNLAYWHAKRGLKYGSPEALAEVKRWMEHQAFYLTEASIDLARERGPCREWKSTCYARGEFPWQRRAAAVNELTSFEPSLPWDDLVEPMMKYGIHNGLLMAIAPVESSSVVIDSTNGIEMPMSLITTKESKGGSLVQVVPEYHRLAHKYELMWDQPDCINYLRTAAVLAAYVDQSISTNTFYSPRHFEGNKVPATLVMKNLFEAQRLGLKTLYYSLMDKRAAKAELAQEEEDCEACKL